MSQRLKNFPNIPGINIAGTVVPLSDSIRTLGVTLDKNLSLSKHVSAVCGSANFHIRALRHIRRALTEDMAKALAVSLVQSRLDYANSLVHGACNIKKLQTIQNSLARIVLGSQPNVSAVGRLTCLHWLPVHSRITFKIACLTYKTLATGQPTYLRILLNQYVPSRQLRSSSQYLLEQRTLKLLSMLQVLGKVKQRAKFQRRISMHHAVMRICISRRLSIVCAQKWGFWGF